MKDATIPSLPYPLLRGVLLTIWLGLSYQVLKGYLLTLAWAVIIAYVMWPLYAMLQRRMPGRQVLSAAIMTFFIAVVSFLLVYWFAGLFENELRTAYEKLMDYAAQRPYQLPETIKRIPGVGEYSERWLERLNKDQDGLVRTLLNWAKQWLGQFAKMLGGIGHNVMKLGIVLVTVFFCFRDGDRMFKQITRGLMPLLGTNQAVYMQAAGDTTRAVVYGLVLAAMTQGVFAGVGYAFAGIRAPVLFGVITALLALIPMGATLVWFPIGVSLVLSGELWPGIGLLFWGFFAVSTVDNVIRPVVISGASQVPFLVVMLGVLGGLSAFGFIGLFLGPVILSVLLSIWKVWLMQQPT